MRCSFFISALRWIMDRERGVLCSCIPDYEPDIGNPGNYMSPRGWFESVYLFVSVCHRGFIAPRIADREQGQSEHFLPKGLRYTHTQIHTGKHGLQSIMMRINGGYPFPSLFHHKSSLLSSLIHFIRLNSGFLPSLQFQPGLMFIRKH